jgi:hypothetical protein
MVAAHLDLALSGVHPVLPFNDIKSIQAHVSQIAFSCERGYFAVVCVL